MLFSLLIYFLTCLFLDLSIYSFQNRPVPISRLEVVGGVVGACLLLSCLFQFVKRLAGKNILKMTYFVLGGA